MDNPSSKTIKKHNVSNFSVKDLENKVQARSKQDKAAGPKAFMNLTVQVFSFTRLPKPFLKL